MKNTIIFLLTVALVYFILSALGTFNFGSMIEHDTRAIFAKERQEAVMKSEFFNIALVCDPDNGAVEVQLQGVEKAVDEINEKGGILSKPIKLHIKRATDLAEHNQALQECCIQRDIALCIGPFSSDYIASMRSLSQFQALPLISSCTIFPDTLPELKPENYITFFSPLKEWTKSIITHIKQQGHKDILLVSPSGRSYGALFAADIEREGRQQSGFNNIYRVNYQKPFNRENFTRVLRHYSGRHLADAIVFTGEYPDFMSFCALAKEFEVTQDIYGTDDLNVEDLAEDMHLLPSRLFLPYAVYGEEKKQDMPRYASVTIWAIAKAIEKGGSYNPETLIQSLYEYKASEAYAMDNPVRISIEEVKDK